MKNRRGVLLTLLLIGGMILAACSGSAAPTPTVVATPPVAAPPTSVPTMTPPATVASATAATLAEADQPVGGLDVAWENVIQPELDVLASVNGVPIQKQAYLEELRQELTNVTNSYDLDWYDEQTLSYLPSFQDEVLQQMINEELARQLAIAEGIAIDGPAHEAELARVRADVLDSGEFGSWQDFLDAYGWTQEDIENNVTNYLVYQGLLQAHGGPVIAEQVHAAHILVDTEETAHEVLDRLKSGDAFADLALEYSTDTGSGAQGGDLGWFPRGVMVPEFEEAAFSLGVGEISGLVESQFGYHIIQVLGKETRPLDPALLEQMQGENLQVWFDAQMQSASIEVHVQFETPAS